MSVIPPASILFPKLVLPFFEDGRFTATRFDSSADKAKFANQLLRFIAKGFPEAGFNEAFYRRLSMCFSHIAHCDKGGFWGHFFASTEGRIEFVDQTIRGGGGGNAAWTYCDVEQAVGRRVREADVLEVYRAARAAEIKGAERELLRRLKARYEPEPVEPSAAAPASTGGMIPAIPIAPIAVHRQPAVQLGLF